MHSAVISARRSYPAMPLARQLAHQRSVHPGPLVLGTDSLKSPAPTADRDRPVSRVPRLPWEQTIPLSLSRHRRITALIDLPSTFRARVPSRVATLSVVTGSILCRTTSHGITLVQGLPRYESVIIWGSLPRAAIDVDGLNPAHVPL